MASFTDWLKANKTIIVHSLSVAGMVAASAAKASGNKTAVASIGLVTAAFHLSEGLANGGGLDGAATSISEAASALQDLIGSATAAKGAATPVA